MKSVIFRNVQFWCESACSHHDGRWEHIDLAVTHGRITHIGRPGSAPPSAGRRPLVFDWPDVCVLPGLINPHDHLELNLFPRLGLGPYANSYEWSRSIYRPGDSPIADVLAIPIQDRLALGGYKNLLCGVTTVCHHNPYHKCFSGRHFPVKVLKDYQWSHSVGLGQHLEHSHRAAKQRAPWIIHAAEGVDSRAASEIGALNARGLLTPNTVIVHGVAIDDRDIALLERHGASLIWCPSSNLFLFGATAPVDNSSTGLGWL